MAFKRTGSSDSLSLSSSRSHSRSSSLDSIAEDAHAPMAPLALNAGPAAPSALARHALAPLNLGGASGAGLAGDRPVTYEHGSLRRDVRRTQEVGHGEQAKIFGGPRSVLKVFGSTRFDADSRDSEFNALTQLHRRVPGLVPQPLSSGQVTMRSGTRSASFEMERVRGESLRNQLSSTPELKALRPLLGRFQQALRSTGTTWDNTPGNIMRTTGGSYRFIDVGLNTEGTRHAPPHVFAHDVLRTLAVDTASAARAMTTTLELPPTSTAPSHLFPALTPTFKPKKAKPKSGSSSAATTLPPIRRR
jgi:hypothetical protein